MLNSCRVCSTRIRELTSDRSLIRAASSYIWAVIGQSARRAIQWCNKWSLRETNSQNGHLTQKRCQKLFGSYCYSYLMSLTWHFEQFECTWEVSVCSCLTSHPDKRASGTSHPSRCFWMCCWWRAWNGRSAVLSFASFHPVSPPAAPRFQSTLETFLSNFKKYVHKTITRGKINNHVKKSEGKTAGYRKDIVPMKVIIFWLTQKVPDEDILKESRRFETMLKNLLQSPDESVLSTEQKGQTASLWKTDTTGKHTCRS